MSTEEYYHVFESILYAAILTLLIHGWSRMIVKKGEYKSYWGFTVISINFGISIIYRYFVYRTFAFYDIINTPFDFIILIFLPAASSLLAVHIAFPENFTGVDLKQHLIKYRFWIFQSVIIYALSNIQHSYLTTGWTTEILVSNLGVVTAYVVFLFNKKIRIVEVVQVLAILIWAVFLFQDLESLGLN